MLSFGRTRNKKGQIHTTRPADIEQLTRACYFQIALETILLPMLI